MGWILGEILKSRLWDSLNPRSGKGGASDSYGKEKLPFYPYLDREIMINMLPSHLGLILVSLHLSACLSLTWSPHISHRAAPPTAIPAPGIVPMHAALVQTLNRAAVSLHTLVIAALLGRGRSIVVLATRNLLAHPKHDNFSPAQARHDPLPTVPGLGPSRPPVS